MEPWLLAIAAVLCVSLLSLLGAAGLVVRSLLRHDVLLLLVALAVGALLGDAFLHILPDATGAWGGFPPELGLLVLFGFLPFFLLEGALRWRHSHSLGPDGTASHHGHPGHPEAHHHEAVAAYGWVSFVGSSLHNALDGAVIAASYLVDPALGTTTAIAVGLHEIPHELGDFAILVRSGMTPRRALRYNLLSALIALLGAAVVLFLPWPSGAVERYALPLTVGGFIYIAAADLVPELHHHTGSRRHATAILVGILSGIALMALLLRLE